MKQADDEQQHHEVLDHLDKYSHYYDLWSDSVYGLFSPGTGAAINIDSFVFQSMSGTLRSIRATLGDGRIGDAYTLLRRYFDSAMLSIYTNLYLRDKFSLETPRVRQIEDWIRGKQRIPEYRVMSQYVRASQCVGAITELLFNDDRYRRIRDRCNDHTHYNYFLNVLVETTQIYASNRDGVLEQFSCDLQDLIVFHVSYIFYSESCYMMSSDYCDALDCGLTPDPQSEYWVAPFIQELFSEIVVPRRPDVAKVIQQHTSMHLE